MKKHIGIVITLLVSMLVFAACGETAAPASKAPATEQSAEKAVKETVTEATASEATNETPQVKPDNKTDDDLGWDGEWNGGGVSVTIRGAGTDWTEVDFDDEEMHSSLDEVTIDGNTLTGVYRITLEMYPEGGDNLPEQEWTITMVKDGGSASYSRTTVLTWFNLNEDGTYGHTITKENSASLTKVITNSN